MSRKIENQFKSYYIVQEEEALKMINKLHLAMIELYKGDAKRIQHFCKVHSYAKLIAETENVDKKMFYLPLKQLL